MTSSYLVCELCGKFGPPAGFFFKDGVRMCYECFFEDKLSEQKPAEKQPPVLPPAEPPKE